MNYKVDDAYLDKVDALIDSVMELSQASDTINSMGIALVNLKKLEQVRKNATELCDAMEDGFPEYGKDDDENEETAEECTDPNNDDPAPVRLDPECDGSGFVAY